MKIPVVFAFDENYALPASVAITSLQGAKDADTEYEVVVLQEGLTAETRRRFEDLCPIRWVEVRREDLGDVPIGYSGLATWYRLLLAKLLPDHDRVIWSDVDVVFKGDLSDVYQMDLDGASWAGVVVEKADAPDGYHCRWGNNDRIYIPSFMVADLSMWRRLGLTEVFLENIRTRRDELRLFDLDILNMSCSPIAALPFAYGVLENVMYSDSVTRAHEWPWLRHHYSREELERAKREAVIIHYAGGRTPKVWWRRRERIPDEYWHWLEKSPFFDREYYFPGWPTAVRRLGWKMLSKLHPSGRMRKVCRERLRGWSSAGTVDPVPQPRSPFAAGVRVSAPEGLVLGCAVEIGEETRIFAEGGVRIGDFTKVGAEVRICSFERNRLSDWMVPYDNIRILRAVEIGRYVDVGARSVVQCGVRIGDGAILQDGSVVFRSVPARAIVAGNPARIVGWREAEPFRTALDPDRGAGGLTSLADYPVKSVRIEGFREEMSGGPA